MSNLQKRRILILILIMSGVLLAVSLAYGRRHWQLARFPELCQAAAKGQRWERLEQLCLEWSGKAPAESIAWYWLGESLKGQRRYQEAVQAFGRVSMDEPRGIDAAIAEMQILFHALDRPLDAIVIADRLLDVDPRLPDPRRNRIYFFAMTLQRARLLHEIREAIVHRADLPDHYIYMLTLEELTFRDGDAVTEKWLNQTPTQHELRMANLVHRAKNARTAVLLASSPERIAKYQDLLAEVSEGLRQFPHEISLLDFSMLNAMDRGDSRLMGELLGLVPDTAAEDPVFWIWRGRFANQTADFQDAETSLARAIELHPLAWHARNELAQVYRSTNRPDTAGKIQTLAAVGSGLAADVRLMGHIRDASPEFLQRLGKYATACGDWKTADGVFRRNVPTR